MLQVPLWGLAVADLTSASGSGGHLRLCSDRTLRLGGHGAEPLS